VSLDLPKNKQQQLLVDDHLRLIGDPTGSVFALGDCSYIEDKPLPPTAQVAERQGRYLAKSLSQFPVMTYAPPMQFESLGMLAYVGDYQAVTDLPQFKFGGFHSWLLWRSAYATRLGSWRLRLQVPFDWFKTFFYGRDVSRF
jgi:NADH:ubiquinone reductase (non-electrogenic)